MDIMEINSVPLREDIVMRVLDECSEKEAREIAKSASEQRFWVSANNDLLNGFLTLEINDGTARVAHFGVVSWAKQMDCRQQLLCTAEKWCKRQGITLL